MEPEIIMEKLTFLKEVFDEKELSRIFDHISSDLIANQGYEEQIDIDFAIDDALNYNVRRRHGPGKAEKIYEDSCDVFLPIAKDIYKVFEKSSKALYERVINSDKPDDLPSIYKG